MSSPRWVRIVGFAFPASAAAVCAVLAISRLDAAAQPAQKPAAAAQGASEKSPASVYELRTYTTLPGRLPALHRRFREHTIRLFEKHGMKNLYYFTPLEKDDTLVYLLAHTSREAAEASWAAFRGDPEWQQARAASEQDGRIVMKVESVFLEATDYSPKK